MKPIKMLSLAALAALMAMAFVGTSAAMAEYTVLCSNDSTSSCTEVTHVHDTTSTKAQIQSEGNPTIECNVLFLGDTLTGTSAPLIIHGTFTYSSCNNSCTVTEENGPAEIKVLRTATELSAVTGGGLVHVNCFFGVINCRYNGTGLEGHGLGPLSSPTTGAVTLTEQEMAIETGTCPPEAFLTITTHPLAATYIASVLHYCVDFGQNNGFYNDSACTEQASVQTKLYDLVSAPPGRAVGEVLCVLVNNGLWQVNNAGICETMSLNNTGSYEKGTITAVK